MDRAASARGEDGRADAADDLEIDAGASARGRPTPSPAGPSATRPLESADARYAAGVAIPL